jgi:hypothetical protein
MRAKRMDAVLKMPADQHLIVGPDAPDNAVADIPAQAFERK